MKFVVAIPSYNRAHVLKSKTLAYLRSEEIEPALITVFVASQAEKTLYEHVLDPRSYGQIVVGVLGLDKQRNFIQNYYPEGVWILSLDDDIKGVKFLTPKPLADVADRMFELTEAEGAFLWSINAVNNLYWCRERVSVGKIFCVGCFYGVINRHCFEIPPVSTVEDKWRTLTFYLKDGKTLRYDGACVDTVYNAKGGLYEHRLLHRTQEVRSIVREFADHCRFKFRRDGMTAEVYWKPLLRKKISLFPADDITTIQ